MFCRSTQGPICSLFIHVLKSNPGKFTPQIDKLLAVHFAQTTPNRRFGAARRCDINPAGGRGLAFRCDDLHRLTITQARPKRHTNAINLGRNTSRTNTGVDGVCKINWRGPARQLDHLTLWRKAKYLISVHFQFKCLKKLSIVPLSAKSLGQRRNPS